MSSSATGQDDGARLRLRMEELLAARPFSPGPLGWILPLVITLVAAALRLRNLDIPHLLIFDETYYLKDAYALLLAGHELVWPEGADEDWLAGDPQPTDEGSFVVHPPLGKWLIALGIHLFGVESGFGWRVSSAVTGALCVLLITLIAQRMFRSVFLGTFAGVLTAVEGHHLVMSRVALLDIFMTLFVLAAFGALLADRYAGRRRLAAELAPLAVDVRGAADGQSSARGRLSASEHGPRLLLRPWRLAAAVLLGCAVAVKLSALAFVAVFGVMVVLWDLEARRTAGVRRWVRAGLLRDTFPAALTVLPLALTTYVVSWSGWLRSSEGWGRQWHLDNPAEGAAQLVPGPLRSLWEHHRAATDFHTGLDTGHDYASSPWTWLFMGRPVSMHYQSYERGEHPPESPERSCPHEHCSSAIVDLANPFIWWTGLLALVLVVGLWLGRRDWRYGAILSGYAAGYAVWMLFPDRTMFFFYTISFHPFLVLAITAIAALVLRAGISRSTARRQGADAGAVLPLRRRNTVVVLCWLLVAVAVSVFFHPVWTGELIPYEQWRMRMWLDSWI